MAITTYFRGIRFIKDYIRKYLLSIFYAAKKEQITFTDGYKHIKFSRDVEVIKRASWDFRKIPAVLIGDARVEYQVKSIAKDFVDESQYNETGNPFNDVVPQTDQRVSGGDISITLSLDIRATTTEERDNLADIVCLYLAHPDAKDYLLKQGIAIEGAPSVSGEKEIAEPNTDYPIYSSMLTVRFITPWRTYMDADPTLEAILVDIEAELDFDAS